MRLRYLLTDWWTARKYRHAFLTLQKCASWKPAKTAPTASAPKDSRRQWKPVLRFKRTSDVSERLELLKGRAEQKRMRMLG